MSIATHEIKKACVIQLGRMGDVFLTTSYFKQLKQHLPWLHITFVVKQPNQKILKDNPYIDEILVIPKAKGWSYYTERVSLYRRLAKSGFDLVLDHQFKPSSMQLSWVTGAKYRFGLDDKRFVLPWIYTHRIPYDSKLNRYSATQKFDLLAPLGIQPEPYSMDIVISHEEQYRVDHWLISQNLGEGKFIVLSPGSMTVHKTWRSESFAQVADHFAEQGLTPVILWGPGEESIAESVLQQMKNTGVKALNTSPQEAVALLKRAALFITNDGGIMHFSLAAGVKTVTVFAGTRPAIWAVTNAFSHHRHLHNNNYTRKMKDPTWGIAPAEVVEAAEALLVEPLADDYQLAAIT